MELWRTHIHLLTTSGEDVEVEQPGVSAQGRWRGGGTGQFFYKKNILKNDVNTFNIYIFFQLLFTSFFVLRNKKDKKNSQNPGHNKGELLLFTEVSALQLENGTAIDQQLPYARFS